MSAPFVADKMTAHSCKLQMHGIVKCIGIPHFFAVWVVHITVSWLLLLILHDPQVCATITV